MTTALLVFLGALSRLVPHPPNAAPLGALALFAGARLTGGRAIAVPLLAMALSDFFLDFGTGRALFSITRLTIYATFASIALLGRCARSGARSPGLAGLSVASSLLFFATSNFAEWLSSSLYPKDSAGLALCYAAALPFLANTVLADLAGTAVLFGTDSLARRARVRIGVAAAVAGVLLVGETARAQQLFPQASETVVVTATAAPEEEERVGAATTVISRARIEQGGFRTVAEVLRSVPGIDIVRSGSDGSVTFAELRGANSTQTLVLVDGQRLNSPYFPGYDLSGLTTENIERIEIVRGPYSALYGSDAIGGVIQIFTRAVGPGLGGDAAVEAGSAGQRNGSLSASYGSGAFGMIGSVREARVDGDRANSDWRQRNGSLRLEGRIGQWARLAVEGALASSDLGVPGPVQSPSLRARYGTRDERIALPMTFVPAEGQEATVLLARVESRPTFDDPDSGFRSQTRARSLQARLSDSWTSRGNRLTGFLSWERGAVDDGSNFGVNLDGQHTTMWGAGVEDSLAFAGGFTATGGARYDHHSQFGQAWSPRATLTWLSPDSRWKLRAAGGGAFRAPTVGELYYPFSGNPDLKPERSTSWELGVERYVSGGRVEASLFWNDYRDLIVYDFSRFANFNIGRARTRGAEIAWRQEVARPLSVEVGYTYLDARDRVTGDALIRRPRHRAFLSANLRAFDAFTVSPRAVFVGRRADRDPVTGTAAESPSYLRYDLFARWDRPHLAPFARIENLADRRYEEVDGYPAPRRRWAAGLEAKF